MARNATDRARRRSARAWRTAPFAVAAGLLLLPLAAMQVTDEVAWDGADFAVFGAMLLAACGAVELATRATASLAYRGAVGIAAVAAFLLVWINLAVGVIGSEDDPANRMFAGVLAVALLGALVARFRPRGMARALAATALAQGLVGALAVAAGLGTEGANWPGPILGLTGVFTALWLTSAALFRKAAKAEASSGPRP